MNYSIRKLSVLAGSSASKFFGSKLHVNRGIRRNLSVLDQYELFEKDTEKTFIGQFGDKAILVNDVLCRQSVICLQGTFLLWNAKTFADITYESLELIPTLLPRVELLLVGCGETLPGRLPADLVAKFKAKGIVIEASNSSSAASTFNFLNAEGRSVAAAILTPQPWDDADHFNPDEFL